jgi:error-prone DNA polymerase
LPQAAPRPEIVEPPVTLAPMSAGREVVEDYRAVGLSLRRHPVAFLRAELAAQGMIPCEQLRSARDGRRVRVGGIVLVRQKPGSAKGVMFITLEDETAVANIVVWPSLFEAQRRLVLSATMLGCLGRVQREGDVIHVVAEKLLDLSALLRGVGTQDDAFTPEFPVRTGRGDEAKHGGSPDQRETKPRIRDIHPPRMPPGIRVPTRDFR